MADANLLPPQQNSTASRLGWQKDLREPLLALRDLLYRLKQSKIDIPAELQTLLVAELRRMQATLAYEPESRLLLKLQQLDDMHALKVRTIAMGNTKPKLKHRPIPMSLQLTISNMEPARVNEILQLAGKYRRAQLLATCLVNDLNNEIERIDLLDDANKSRIEVKRQQAHIRASVFEYLHK